MTAVEQEGETELPPKGLVFIWEGLNAEGRRVRSRGPEFGRWSWEPTRESTATSNAAGLKKKKKTRKKKSLE